MGSGPESKPDERTLVEDCWNQVAERYLTYWSPRFEPYLRRAVDAFTPSPEGPLVVVGCGPGDELVLLARKHPGRTLVGLDLSPGMVAIARRRAREAALDSVLVDADDAAQVSGRLRQAGGLFSAFILQLLPNPMASMADWSRALRRDGAMAHLFWARRQGDGPFARFQDLLRRKIGEEQPEWEEPVLAKLERLGLRIALDERVEEEMVHGSPEEFWREACESGALKVIERRLGKPLLDEIGAEWLRDHGLERRGESWVHRPAARLWVLERSDRD